MKKEFIVAKIGDDHSFNCDKRVIGREGEALYIQLVCILPSQADKDWAYIDFKKPNGETFKTSRLQVENNEVYYDIPQYLLDTKGELEVQLVLQNANGEIWESSPHKFIIRNGINATDDIPNKEDFIAKAQNILDEVNQSAEEMLENLGDIDTALEYVNLIDCSKPISKTDGITVNKDTVILNGSAWVGQVTYKVNVEQNADYVLRYKISRETGVAGISIGSAESTSDIVENVDNVYRSALTFNTGNNSVVYIKFRVRNADCSNYAYNNISLIRIGDFKDTFIKKNGMKNTICCWGDSLTAGAGASESVNINGLVGATMPKALAHLLGYAIPNEASAFDGNEDKAVINFGVGGETSRTILCRMGAMQMVVNNITIPSSGSVSFSEIRCSDGERVYPLHQKWSGSRWVFDTCYIGGVEGTLTYSGAAVETETETGIYTFTRKMSGSEIVIDRPTAIISPIHKRYGDILILQIGHNGGWDNNYDTLVNQYRMAIEKAQTDRYIIIGMTSGNAESNREWEYALQTAFQRHYINMREYLSHPIYDENGVIVNCYGLADRGFTPTQDDLAKIAVGEVPRQLKLDSAHFNSYGYYTEAEQVYKRGKELGYWK